MTDRNPASLRYLFYVLMRLAVQSETFLNELRRKVKKTSPMSSFVRESLYADLVLLFCDKDNTFLHQEKDDVWREAIYNLFRFHSLN